MTNGLISPLPKALSPNCSKLAFRPQTSNVRVLGSELHKILHQISSYFTILVILLDKVMSIYSQKIAKNPSKIVFLVPFQICKFSLSFF